MDERYVAFLRAINVGGNRIIKMADLKQALETGGFQNVKTYIASGNVLITHPGTDHAEIRDAIEALIAEHFGFDVDVMLRTHAAVRDMVANDPFGHVELGKTITGYVTLLYHPPDEALVAAIEALSDDVATLTVRNGEVFTTYYRERDSGRAEQGRNLEKLFKISGTTRNWNTIVKLAGM